MFQIRNDTKEKRREAITIFRYITIEDKQQLVKLLKETNFDSYEYSFATLLVWQHIYETKFDLEDDFGLILGQCTNHKFCSMPLGKESSWEKSLKAMQRFFTEQNHPFIIHGASKEYANWIKERNPQYFCREDRDNFEYIYSGEKMRALNGRRFSQKRNHIHWFEKNYEGRYEYRHLSKEAREECMAVLKEWIYEKDAIDEDSVEEERQAIEVMFKHMDALGLVVGGIYIDGSLKGFTIGEKMIDDTTAHILIEKCDGSIRGLYPFLNRAFLTYEFPDVAWVNREEDMGIEGLRKAKQSYYPARLLEKYVITECELHDCSTCLERREK